MIRNIFGLPNPSKVFLCLGVMAITTICGHLKALAFDKSTLQEGKIYYTSGDKINLRTGPSQSSTIIGTLKLGDAVTLLHVGAPDNVYVEVQYKDILTEEMKTAFITSEKISEVKKDLLVSSSTSSSGSAIGAPAARAKEYFAIQNLATEKMRVYERCFSAANCAHKMVWETDVVVGRAEEGNDYLTKVGFYKVTEWRKFYEDGSSPPKYPAWYKKSYMPPPDPGG
jgi:hypothetical protein